jgi:hypothetical protein
MPSVVIEGEVITPVIIVVITMILVIFFWCFVAYKLVDSPTDKLLLSCQPGECGLNFLNGEKQCPRESDGVILIDPSYQVCSSRSVCTNSLAPYALLPDGSTNNFGLCATGTTCRCLSKARCSSHVSAIFKVINGNLSTTAPANRHLFHQINAGDNSEDVSFTSQTTNFCAIKTSSLNRLAPGACSFSNADYLDPQNTLLLATDCVNSNPCVRGVMAFEPLTPGNLEASGLGVPEVISIPVTCVNATVSCDTDGTPCPGNVCPSSQAPYFDSRWNLVRCANINYERV